MLLLWCHHRMNQSIKSIWIVIYNFNASDQIKSSISSQIKYCIFIWIIWVSSFRRWWWCHQSTILWQMAQRERSSFGPSISCSPRTTQGLVCLLVSLRIQYTCCTCHEGTSREQHEFVRNLCSAALFYPLHQGRVVPKNYKKKSSLDSISYFEAWAKS